MKEKSDFVEIEIKVRPMGRHDRVVELAEAAAPPGWRMVRKPHVAFFDLYFDTPEGHLAVVGHHLRARFGVKSFRKGGKYKLFFKERGIVQAHRSLARREVRTDLVAAELLKYPCNGTGLPGRAASLAYGSLGYSPEQALPLVPTCLISTFRRYFTMRSTRAEDTDCMNVAIESSTALATRGMDIRLLIESGFVDGVDLGKPFHFELAEAELTVENEDRANAAFASLARALSGEFEVLTIPKYEMCLAELARINENP
jgi:CYTH domain